MLRPLRLALLMAARGRREARAPCWKRVVDAAAVSSRRRRGVVATSPRRRRVVVASSSSPRRRRNAAASPPRRRLSSLRRYGTYVLRIDGAAATGSAQGNPAEWRKMTYIRDLDAGEAAEACGHDHSH